MDVHGVVEFEIDGKKRGLRHDNYALLIASRKEGGSLALLMKGVQNGDTLSFVNLIYGMAVSYCEDKGRGVDFTINDVGDWINELGGEKISGYMEKLFKIPEAPKNSSSPQETGVLTS